MTAGRLPSKLAASDKKRLAEMRVLIGALLWAAVYFGWGYAAAAEAVSFGTDWKAEAEHGGYYQAIATGIYQRHGLDVTLRQGGPQVNHAQLLAAGRLDFNLAPTRLVLLILCEKIFRWSRSRRSSKRTPLC